jgi:integrase
MGKVYKWPFPSAFMQESIVKKDIHESERHLDWYLKRIKVSSMSENQKKRIFQFVEDLKIGKAGKKVRAHRLTSYLCFLLKLHSYFGKDLIKVTEKEATEFYKDLMDNRVKRENGLPYSQNTKDLFVRTLKRYLGWELKGRDNQHYRKVAGWMKEEQPKSNKRAITFEQTKEIINKEKNARNKALFCFLFDSGCRIEEALNVRLQDLEVHKRDNGKDEYFMVRVRFSKTRPRKISLPLSSSFLNRWLKEHPVKKPDAFLFPLGYDNSRKIIQEMSKRVLGFTIAPHELRHSSVTFYVQKFGLRDIAGFYYRYGWVFGSREAKTYIDEHLIGGEQEQEKIVKMVESDRFAQLEREVDRLKTENRGILGLLKKLNFINKTLLKTATKDKKIEAELKKQLKEMFSVHEEA